MDASIEQHQVPPQQLSQSSHQHPLQHQHVFYNPPPSHPHPGQPHPHNPTWMMAPPQPQQQQMNGHDAQHLHHEQHQLQQQQNGGGAESGSGGEGLDLDVDGDEGLDDDGREGHETPEMMMVDGQASESPGAGPTRRSRRSGASGVTGPRKPEGKVSLADLKDCPPGVKPYHAYSTLIRYAIKGSDTGMGISCIYDGMAAYDGGVFLMVRRETPIGGYLRGTHGALRVLQDGTSRMEGELGFGIQCVPPAV